MDDTHLMGHHHDQSYAQLQEALAMAILNDDEAAINVIQERLNTLEKFQNLF